MDCLSFKKRYSGNIYAYMKFMVPYPGITDYEVIILGFIFLLEQYAYNIESDYVKLTLGYTMHLPSSYDISFTLGKAIPLWDSLGNKLCKRTLYDMIEQVVRLYGEKYQDSLITGLFMNIYYKEKESLEALSFPNLLDSDMIGHIINVMDSDIISGNLPEVESPKSGSHFVPSNISAIKEPNQKECRPFIVADIETLMVDDVHVPYAAGYLVVNPGDDLTSVPFYSIPFFYSEHFIDFYPNFKDRSERMLFEFVYSLEECVRKNRRLRTVYFHNFARFDGILLLRYYTSRGNKYKIKPLIGIR